MDVNSGMFAAIETNQLREAMASARRAELLIGAAFHPERQALLLTYADGSNWWLDARHFVEPSGDGSQADLRRLRISDYGQTLCCGDNFEAAADWMRETARPAGARRTD